MNSAITEKQAPRHTCLGAEWRRRWALLRALCPTCRGDYPTPVGTADIVGPVCRACYPNNPEAVSSEQATRWYADVVAERSGTPVETILARMGRSTVPS